MPQPKYDDPFYFMLPIGAVATTALPAARRHIAATFGIDGPVEIIRMGVREPTLCRMVGWMAVAR